MSPFVLLAILKTILHWQRRDVNQNCNRDANPVFCDNTGDLIRSTRIRPVRPGDGSVRDTRDKLVVGRWSNSIVGGLEPCMVSGRTCPAVWVRLYRLGTRDPVGTLVKTGSAHWREYSLSDEGGRIVGNARFNFQQQRRSGNVIQLHDPSRNVQLEIDLDDDVVRYGEDGGPKRPLYGAWGLRDLR